MLKVDNQEAHWDFLILGQMCDNLCAQNNITIFTGLKLIDSTNMIGNLFLLLLISGEFYSLL